MDWMTRDARRTLWYLFAGGVALAVLAALLWGPVFSPTDDTETFQADGDGAYDGFKLAVWALLMGAASVLTSVAVIGWGVLLGVRAAGLRTPPPGDAPSPIARIRPLDDPSS